MFCLSSLFRTSSVSNLSSCFDYNTTVCVCSVVISVSSPSFLQHVRFFPKTVAQAMNSRRHPHPVVSVLVLNSVNRPVAYNRTTLRTRYLVKQMRRHAG